MEPTFILHRHPFQNTSWLLELFTLNHGRFSAVARSARGPKSRYRGQLEPFFPLLTAWTGKRELKTLTLAETESAPLILTGNALFSGFYLNELLIKLLHREDPHPQLFSAYQTALLELSKGSALLEITLRRFEKKLLEELGYGLNLSHTTDTHAPIQPEMHYQFIPQQGLILTPEPFVG